MTLGPAGRRRAAAVAVLAVYALCSWAIALPLGLAPSSHLPTCACADVAQETWWLAVAAHAPFALHTGAVDVPRGVSLLDNASFPLLGALLAPVTRSIGPVASLVILLRLAFLTSAVAAYAVLRRLRGTDLGPAVGGALYAFSPYMTHQAGSHFFLAFGPLPPLLLGLVHRRMTSPARRTWPAGVALGLLATAQFFIDSEVLLLTAVAAAVTLAVFAGWGLAHRVPLRAPARRLAALVAPAVAVAAPFLAIPVWETLTGPGRLSGSTQPHAEVVGVLATFLPGDRAVVAGLWGGWRAAAGTYLGHSSYLGPLLVVVCVLGAVRWWRADGLVRSAGVMAIVAWVLQLGAHLTWRLHPTAVPLPFDVLQHLPLFDDIIPSRFSELVGLGAGALVAAVVDGIATDARRAVVARREAGPAGRARAAGGQGRLGPAVLSAAVVVAALALAAPDRGFGAFGTGPAKTFAPARGGEVLAGSPAARIPHGAVVLAYPVPAFPDDQAMLWQAVGGLRFRLVGGYAIRPGPGRRTDRAPLLPPPVALPRALVEASTRPAAVRPGSPAWTAAARALPAFLRRNRVRAVVVERAAPGAPGVDALVRAVLGPPTTTSAGLAVWMVPPG